jgi:hypothetical protein
MGWIVFLILTVFDIGIHVIIQMYYEGHRAFTDGDHI